MPYTPPEPDAPDPGAGEAVLDDCRERVQEREVRLTAQRLLRDHLHPGPDKNRPAATYWADVDLDLTGCQVRRAAFARARFTGGAHFYKAWFGEARFTGPAWFYDAQFTDRAAFQGPSSPTTPSSAPTGTGRPGYERPGSPAACRRRWHRSVWSPA